MVNCQDGSCLSTEQVSSIIADAVIGSEYNDARVLLIVPDLTRTAPIGLVYKTLYTNLVPRVKSLDCLVALGTHRPLPVEEICRRLEITPQEYAATYANKTALYNHEWDDPDMLQRIGVISGEEIQAITGDLLRDQVPVYINRRVLEYDRVIVAGSVFPHELAGFSGGNKYFFPGVSAGSVLDAFHWLGALVTNRKINGTAHNPVRTLIDRAAAFIDTPTLYLNFVMKDLRIAGIFPGTSNSAWLNATELASDVNIVYTGRQYRRVVCLASRKYDDLWTAAKAVYKAEAIVEDGGEIIVYAPHIRCFSHSHEEMIRRAGYHPASWFMEDISRAEGVSGTVLAHLAVVRCEGNYTCGEFNHRITVKLATEIDELSCLSVNLQYLDYHTVDFEVLKQDKDTMIIENAGDILYKPNK